MSYAKMIRWSKTHRKGVRQEWCGFHTGQFSPKPPPTYGSVEWFVSEAFHTWRRIDRCFKGRRDGETKKRREIIRQEIENYRLLSGIAKFLREGTTP